MIRAILILWTITITIAQAQTASKLPDGEGKALVERTCSKCHTLTGVTRARNSKEGWANIVDDMVSRGAAGSDEEIEQIIEYLAANFGRNKPPAPKLNVNKATPDELISVLAVSKETASAIVAYRDKNGAFKKWEDLEKVSGVDMKQIEGKKDGLEFSE